MYNGMFVVPVPEQATNVSFTDVLAVAATAKHPAIMEVYTTQMLRDPGRWENGTGLYNKS